MRGVGVKPWKKEAIVVEFVWKEQFNIGHEKVDLQHQYLLNLVNEFVLDAKTIKSKPAPASDDFTKIRVLVTELKSYAVNHFQDEEQLMASIHYPDLEAHQANHRLLRQHVEHMEQKVNSMDKHALNKMIIVLRDWLVEHIMVEDKKIGTFILSRLSSPDVLPDR